MSKVSSRSAKKKGGSVIAAAGKSAAAKKQPVKAPSAAGARTKAAQGKAVQRKQASPAARAKTAARPAVKPAAKAAAKSASKASNPKQTAKPVAEKSKKTAPAKVSAKPAAPVAQKAPAMDKPAPVTPKKAPAAKAPDRSLSLVAAEKPEKEKAAPAAVEAPQKALSEFAGFKVHDHVVYPTHGVGKIVAVETQEIAGTRLELFVIVFEQEKMTLRVPLGKAKSVGMRILSSRDTVRTALKTLHGRARIKRTMWSRRAQEYEAKINSGDILLIAEVVRDLHRAEGQPEQSYSERQIYEAALERLAREVGAVEELDSIAAMERVGGALKKAA